MGGDWGPLVLLGSLFVFLVLGVPIAYALGVATLVAAVFVGLPLEAILLKVSDGVDNFALLAIPFFVFAGALMAEGGMAWRLVAFANIFVGFLRGGLAMVNILASMFFGGISGSSIADAITLATKGTIGALISTLPSASAMTSAAGCIRLQWNGALTGSRTALRAPNSDAISMARSTADRSFHGTIMVSSSAFRFKPELSAILMGSWRCPTETGGCGLEATRKSSYQP